MTGPADGPIRPSSTEDTAATPGWVESSVDAAFTDLPVQGEGVQTLRTAYLECLASGGSGDLDIAHDRCRVALLKGLTESEGLDAGAARALELRLEALEAEISARI